MKNRNQHQKREVITERVQEFFELGPNGSVLKLNQVNLVLPGREVVEHLHKLFIENPDKLVRDLEQVENDICNCMSSGPEVLPGEIERGRDVFLILHEGKLVVAGNLVARWPAA